MGYNRILNLQSGIIYGPVASRRLGRSLGLNLLSTEKKVCSFDCLYCQYGFTQLKCSELKTGKYYPSVEEVEEALNGVLSLLNPAPQYITFSGNGEATLHPQFPEIVRRVINIRDRMAPSARTAILSNSAGIINPDIRKAVMLLDERIMKLDSATEDVFRRYNRPRCSIYLKDIISTLESMPGITIQTLFAAGKRGNYFPEHIDAWGDTVVRIHPQHVQIYSLDRSTPSADLIRVPHEDLNNLCSILKNKGIKATAY
jgi:wyosine [tRNA(Phe)-imidazoG37] synthetase (radical SAM superfamily)